MPRCAVTLALLTPLMRAPFLPLLSVLLLLLCAPSSPSYLVWCKTSNTSTGSQTIYRLCKAKSSALFNHASHGVGGIKSIWQ